MVPWYDCREVKCVQTGMLKIDIKSNLYIGMSEKNYQSQVWNIELG